MVIARRNNLEVKTTMTKQLVEKIVVEDMMLALEPSLNSDSALPVDSNIAEATVVLPEAIEAIVEPLMTSVEAVQVASIKAFDLSLYNTFLPTSIPMAVRDNDSTPAQRNLCASIENNFDCKVERKSTRYTQSVELSRVFNDIAMGKCAKLSDEQILANIRSYKKEVSVVPASKAQIALINNLEKELSATDSVVVNSVSTASKRISELLQRKKELNAKVASIDIKEVVPVVELANVVTNVEHRASFVQRLKFLFQGK